MSFEVDRNSFAWANIALCADLTWTAEPVDDFVIANQRLWNQYCRVSKALQKTATENSTKFPSNNHCELTDRGDKRPGTIQNEDSAAASPKSVKDVIPESRLARFYGNFYYDENREKCYINSNEEDTRRYANDHGSDNCDLTECWMLPEVEYLFRKLMDQENERAMRRRRPYSSQPNDFERLSLAGVGCEAAEATLARRVRAVRVLWDPGPATRAPASAPLSPPATPRKMRARRRQPRRSANYAPPSSSAPRYCLDGSAPAPLLCDPSHKFQFEAPRPPHPTFTCQRATARVPTSVQTASNVRLSRTRPSLGRFVGAPSRVPPRCELYPSRRRAFGSPRRDNIQPESPQRAPVKQVDQMHENSNITSEVEGPRDESLEHASSDADPTAEFVSLEGQNASSSRVAASSSDKTYEPLTPSTNTAAVDDGSTTRRLYSTVLSMSAPRPLGVTAGVVRLTQKQIPPGLLKLNPKIILPTTRFRTATVEKKFDELEKEALEQYKTSEESIDTKFNELEKQAVEQYKVSDSNSSCSSGNSGEKSIASSPSTSPTCIPDAVQLLSPVAKVEPTKKSVAKFHKDKTVGSVVIHSQNFPVLDTKGFTNVMHLKNFPAPQRGEKKQHGHKPRKNPRNFKSDSSYAASDTDYEARVAVKSGHKVPVRWAVHVAPPKKRMKKNVTVCVSELLFDREPVVPIAAAICDLAPLRKHAAGRRKMSAHGAGDLEHAIKNT